VLENARKREFRQQHQGTVHSWTVMILTGTIRLSCSMRSGCGHLSLLIVSIK